MAEKFHTSAQELVYAIVAGGNFSHCKQKRGDLNGREVLQVERSSSAFLRTLSNSGSPIWFLTRLFLNRESRG